MPQARQAAPTRALTAAFAPASLALWTALAAPAAWAQPSQAPGARPGDAALGCAALRAQLQPLAPLVGMAAGELRAVAEPMPGAAAPANPAGGMNGGLGQMARAAGSAPAAARPVGAEVATTEQAAARQRHLQALMRAKNCR